MTDLGGVEAVAFSVADNRSGELAAWDGPALARLLRKLEEEDERLFEDLAFDDEELDALAAEEEQRVIAALGWKRGDAADADGRRVVEDVEAEAATVKRILQLRAAGLTLRDVAAALAAEGRRTKRGGRWAAETVRKVLARAGRAA